MKFSACNELGRHRTCVICCVVVRILASGLQQTGNVSNNVGLECVNRGFMYLVSKSPQILASNAFSLGFVPPAPPLLLPPPGSDPSCIELYCEMWTMHQLSILYDSASFPSLIFKRNHTPSLSLLVNITFISALRSKQVYIFFIISSLFRRKSL